VTSETPIRPPTILVVEDSPDDALAVDLTFRSSGISNPLTFLEDGQMALDYLRGEGRYYDRDRWPLPLLMILDLNLPKHGGLDVLEATTELRQTNGVHAVVLSVSDSLEDREAALAFGATRVLQKPIDPVKLLRVISEISAFSLLLVPSPDDQTPGFDSSDSF